MMVGPPVEPARRKALVPVHSTPDFQDEVRCGVPGLKQARTAAKMTIRELGDAVGVSNVVINYWERGKRQPTRAMALNLAGVLGVEYLALVLVANND